MIQNTDKSKIWVLSIMILVLLSGSSYSQKAQSKDEGGSFYWTDIKSFGLQGKGWKDDSLSFNRLPFTAKGVVREPVWNLSSNTSGMYVRFITNATSIKASWSLTSEELAMSHFAGTGVSGLDLYVRQENGSWHWLGVGMPDEMENEVFLVEGMGKASREYMLYLPLYNGVHYVKIGIDESFEIQGVDPDTRKAIVFYGTSITQGGCASRPGMSATAILGRYFDRELINLGFSGNGLMEPELAHLLAELNPLIYFIDCLPNLKADQVKERVEPFVAILREAHPDTPIVLSEGVSYNNAFLVEDQSLRNYESFKSLRIAYENLLLGGTRKLYYQVSDGQLGSDGEGTVDGVHPNDLGFYRQAKVYQLLLERIISEFQETE